MKPILKLQSGDSMPFVDYMPFQGLESARSAGADEKSASDSSSKGDNDVGLKTLLGLIKELDGLPVDTALVAKSIKDMYSDATLFNNGQLSTDDIVTTYLSALQKIKLAKFNLEQFKTSQNESLNSGGYGEIAIDSNGKIFVQDTETGSMGKMSVEEFQQLQAQDPEKYEALTNSNLLYYRKNDPNFAFRNDVFDVVSNSIGAKKVTEMLLQVANGLGTDTLKKEGYSEKKGNSIISGMKELQEAYEKGMTVNGLYKQGFLSEQQANQTTAALEYLWSSLPENAKTFLKYKSNGSNREAIELMSNLLFSRNSKKSEYLQTLTKDPAESASDGKSGAGNDFLSNVQAGTGGRDAMFHVNLGGKYADSGMTISGSAYGMAIDPSGSPIAQTNMLDMLQESRILGIAKGSNNIYFGEQRISAEALRNIAYLGDEIMRVNVPINSDGSPNFALLKIFNDKQQEFLMSDQTDADRERIFGSSPELAGLVNPDGTLNMSRFAPYVLVNGLTTDKLSGIDPKANEYVQEVKADPKLYQLLKTSLITGSGKTATAPKIDEYSFGDALFKGWGEWLNGYDHLIKGVLYIPIDMNRNAAAMYSGVKLSAKERESMELEYQQNPAFLNYDFNGNGADLLNY